MTDGVTAAAANRPLMDGHSASVSAEELLVDSNSWLG